MYISNGNETLFDLFPSLNQTLEDEGEIDTFITTQKSIISVNTTEIESDIGLRWDMYPENGLDEEGLPESEAPPILYSENSFIIGINLTEKTPSIALYIYF